MNEELRRAIGKRLMEARKSIGQTQAEVAKQLNLERQTISKWERGASMPQSNEWYELGILYGASLDYLVYGIRTMPVSKYGITGRILQLPVVEVPPSERALSPP